MQDTHYIIYAKQLLTMPESPEVLTQYDPRGDIYARDRELLGLIEDGAVVVKEGVIDWVGKEKDLKKYVEDSDLRDLSELPSISTSLLMPGMVDAHTHAVFDGDRSAEFALRNAGKTYLEILTAGGGIHHTVEAVRRASKKRLTELLVGRTYDSVRKGVTTLEVKSGYGLTTSDERKMLRAIKEAQPDVPCELVPCFLGAHTFPREFKENHKGYVDLICNEMIPLVAEQKLASYCDVFCDRGAFDVEESRAILTKGLEYGLTPRLHADELAHLGATELAIEVGASSVDHLEHTPKELFAKLADANVTPLIMPAVNLFLGTIDEAANARAMIAAGCDIAVASDFNPGSAMTQDMQLVTTLACTIHKLTPGEALRGATIGGAKALNRKDIGRIRKGARADFAMFNVPDFQVIPYHFGENHIEGVAYKGDIVYWTVLEEEGE